MCKDFLLFTIFFFTPLFAFASCNDHFRDAEIIYGIPKNLLASISIIESDQRDFALNIKGVPYFPKDKEEAKKIINLNLQKNNKNMDIGCMQINFGYHSSSFFSLDDMLSPRENVFYAAKFLRKLHKQTNNWIEAVKRYHSASEFYQKIYIAKLLKKWPITGKNI